MKVSIIVGGKFHAFNLAKELNLNGYLKQIITSYPKYSLKNFHIEKKKIKSILIKELLLKLFKKFHFFQSMIDTDYFLSNYFSKRASELIDLNNTDILVGWSSFSKEAFLKAKKTNCIKILERGSTHIKYQEKILKMEYDELKIKPNLPSQNIIQKELIEYELADYITIPSEFAKKTYLEYGVSESKLIKVPYGVDLKEFKYLNKKRPEGDKFRLISVGTISIRKGSHILIEAFEQLSLKNSELTFVGPMEKNFKKILKKYKKLKNVKFISKQKQENLKYFYNNSDIFVLYSLEEGLSMVQAQAMACGLPIICSENTGGSEIVDHGINGYVIPIKNIEILKNKIQEFYNDKSKLKNFSLNALKKTKELSWENYGKKLINTYRSILEKKKNVKDTINHR